jgi:magnesium-transporting ATPase (P-type)
MLVTATGMDTEIGHIADLLASTEADMTPLQKQLDGLSKIIATIAGIALVLVVILGWCGASRSTRCSSPGWPGGGRDPDRAARGGHRLVVHRDP